MHVRLLKDWFDYRYNSVVFTTLAGHDWQAALVTEEFTTGGWWNQSRVEYAYGADGCGYLSGGTTDAGSLSTIQLIAAQQHAVAGELVRLENDECIKNFAAQDSFESAYGNILVVTSLTLNDTAITFELYDGSRPLNEFDWVCNNQDVWDWESYVAYRGRSYVPCSDRRAVIANAPNWTVFNAIQWAPTNSGYNREFCSRSTSYQNISAPSSHCLA